MASSATIRSEIYDREERKQQYQAHIRGLNAYERHKKFLKDYVRFYGKDKPTEVKLPVKTDHDTLREGYRYGAILFIRSEEDDLNPSWEQRLVKRYYDKLFKECAEKLYYKRRKDAERSESKEKKKQKRKRNRSSSEDDTEEEERRKGKRNKSKLEGGEREGKDDENFDEFMEGMFPGKGDN
ncbi:hypothetical protein YC2023_002427 [Brassica napus]